MAISLAQSTRGTDLIFRWGGDEFALILLEPLEEGAVQVAERIRSGIQEIKGVKEETIDISIGISFFPENGKDEQELIRVADRALYIAKKGGDKIHVGEE